jgi:hypothetical protein
MPRKKTGCGMTANEQTNLFTRFTQATPKTYVKYGGSGLGLFISKSLTVLQNGAIGVNAESAVGLADPPATHIASQDQEPGLVLSRTMSADEAMRAVRLDILIVEDNLVNQKVLKKQLQKFGWNISVAGNGEEALKWLKGSIYWHPKEDDTNKTGLKGESESFTPSDDRHELDIILMDIEMPIM